MHAKSTLTHADIGRDSVSEKWRRSVKKVLSENRSIRSSAFGEVLVHRNQRIGSSASGDVLIPDEEGSTSEKRRSFKNIPGKQTSETTKDSSTLSSSDTSKTSSDSSKISSDSSKSSSGSRKFSSSRTVSLDEHLLLSLEEYLLLDRDIAAAPSEAFVPALRKVLKLLPSRSLDSIIRTPSTESADTVVSAPAGLPSNVLCDSEGFVHGRRKYYFGSKIGSLRRSNSLMASSNSGDGNDSVKSSTVVSTHANKPVSTVGRSNSVMSRSNSFYGRESVMISRGFSVDVHPISADEQLENLILKRIEEMRKKEKTERRNKKKLNGRTLQRMNAIDDS